jgi:hypothetical protein
MDQTNRSNPIHIARGRMLRIEDGAGTLIHVRAGEIWITEEGSVKDHVLGAGESFVVERAGATLAHAFRNSVVTVDAQQRRPAASLGEALRRFREALLAPLFPRADAN